MKCQKYWCLGAVVLACGQDSETGTRNPSKSSNQRQKITNICARGKKHLVQGPSSTVKGGIIARWWHCPQNDHFDIIVPLTVLLGPCTKCGLSPSSERPERRVDALGHYHERTSLSSNPTEAYVGRNQLGILTGFYFSHSLQYPSIIIRIWEISTVPDSPRGPDSGSGSHIV